MKTVLFWPFRVQHTVRFAFDPLMGTECLVLYLALLEFCIACNTVPSSLIPWKASGSDNDYVHPDVQSTSL
jgi:hypothetical protein